MATLSPEKKADLLSKFGTIALVMEGVKDNKLTPDTAAQLITALTDPPGTITVKANPDPAKRTISVYGLGRMPVTLHRSQWERFPEALAAVRDFIAKHDKYLPRAKGDNVPEVPAELIGDGKPFRVPKAMADAAA